MLILRMRLGTDVPELAVGFRARPASHTAENPYFTQHHPSARGFWASSGFANQRMPADKRFLRLGVAPHPTELSSWDRFEHQCLSRRQH